MLSLLGARSSDSACTGHSSSLGGRPGEAGAAAGAIFVDRGKAGSLCSGFSGAQILTSRVWVLFCRSEGRSDSLWNDEKEIPCL